MTRLNGRGDVAEKPDVAAFTRICPSCARRVPHTVDRCRCGADLSAVTATPTPELAGSPNGSRKTLLWLGFVAVATAAGIAFGAFWRGTTPPVEQPVTVATPPVEVERPVGPIAAVPSPEPASASPTEPAAVIDGGRPTAEYAPGSNPTTAVPAVAAAPDPSGFESVVAQVMPAIVLVEAGASRGSGFFIRPDTLLTNVHVVKGHNSVTIRRASGEVVPARVERTAGDVDVAVLKISPADPKQPTLTMGATADARVGQEVFAIGSALGLFQNTLTRGIVSGIRQTPTATLVQTDAAVNPGNSGGPLMDRNGRVLGIITMGYTERQGLNFAVGIDHARAVLGEGRAAAAPRPTAPASPDMRALSPAMESDTEQRRGEGLRAYEDAMATLGRRADALEGSWRTFRLDCYRGRIVGTFDREWFALFDQRTMQGAVPAGCGGWFSDLRREADEVRAGVIGADEAARRADVFPGIRREIRRRHRLDYPGSER